MKKKRLFWMLATAVLLTSCGEKGVKLSPEAKDRANEVEELLGSTAGEVARAYAMRMALDDSLRHGFHDEKTFNELKKQFNEAKKEQEEKSEKLVKEMSGKERPTTIAEGLPFKLVKPFTTRMGRNTYMLEFVCEVEFTQEYIGSDSPYGLPYVVPVDDNGRVIEEDNGRISLKSPFMNSRFRAPAGSRHEVTFAIQIGTVGYDKTDLQILTSKELRIDKN